MSDLGRSLAFYEGLLGLELEFRRTYREAYVSEIVGVPNEREVEIAALKLPGGDLRLELLQYSTGRRNLEPRSPSDPQASHLCLLTMEIDTVYEFLRERRVSFRSEGPVPIAAGPNAGGFSLYGMDPDEYAVEFHQPAAK